jgi:hypothetical protein
MAKLAGDLLELDDPDPSVVRLDPIDDVEAADVDLQERALHRIPESACRGDSAKGVGELFEDTHDLAARPVVDRAQIRRELNFSSHCPRFGHLYEFAQRQGSNYFARTSVTRSVSASIE